MQGNQATDKYITRQEFEEKFSTILEQYELTRKLVNSQAIAINSKVQAFENTLTNLLSKKPDPAMIREAWIKQVPKIREDLHNLHLQVGTLKAIVSASKTKAKQGVGNG